MPKWPAKAAQPFVDSDLQEVYEACNWHYIWQAEYGGPSEDNCPGDDVDGYDAMETVPYEEDNVDAQIVHAVLYAATNLADYYKRMLDDPLDSDYAQAVDPGTLLRLLTADKTRSRAIGETILSLRNTTLAKEGWSDASYWDMQAKLEMSLTLEVSNDTR
ncbi:hypothetical protein EVJ58_g4719 [Rhodofomes roseus]|uniref:Uncharacterized protein n=1 Tax=Rhodofomes roseus TaxID=34475 RepID=A0A4Y9YFG1_9APHY|nr:hypothetical protein EVJ58_g4719 [Rhodofomes roseus]